LTPWRSAPPNPAPKKTIKYPYTKYTIVHRRLDAFTWQALVLVRHIPRRMNSPKT
jgi:hypothetical protein